jgi:hypothetical protein
MKKPGNTKQSAPGGRGYDLGRTLMRNSSLLLAIILFPRPPCRRREAVVAQPSVTEFDERQQSQNGDTPGQQFNKTNDGESDEKEDGGDFQQEFNHRDFPFFWGVLGGISNRED